MSIINSIIPLVASMKPIWDYGMNYILALAFLATVPVILDVFTRRK